MVQFADVVLVRAEPKSDLAVPTEEEKTAETTEEQEKKNEEGTKSKTVEEIAAEENGESLQMFSFSVAFF